MPEEVKASCCCRCGSAAMYMDSFPAKNRKIRYRVVCLTCGHKGRTGNDPQHAIVMWNKGGDKPCPKI